MAIAVICLLKTRNAKVQWHDTPKSDGLHTFTNRTYSSKFLCFWVYIFFPEWFLSTYFGIYSKYVIKFMRKQQTIVAIYKNCYICNSAFGFIFWIYKRKYLKSFEYVWLRNKQECQKVHWVMNLVSNMIKLCKTIYNTGKIQVNSYLFNRKTWSINIYRF